MGYDFTWSVPKSVWRLYAMTEGVALRGAFRESVHEFEAVLAGCLRHEWAGQVVSRRPLELSSIAQRN